MTYNEIIFMRIKALCKARKISLNKLATMSGVRQSTLNSIGRGTSKNPRLKTIHCVANALGLTLAEFLDYPEMNAYSFEEEKESPSAE